MNEVFVGAIVGMSQTIIGHPMDTIKTRIQCKNQNVSFSNLYAGVSYPLLSSMFINSMSFSFFLSFKSHFQSYMSNIENKENNELLPKCMSNYVGGALSGIVTSPFIHPIEYYKINIQYCSRKPVFILNNIYKGFGMTLIRESLGTAFYFGPFYQFKDNCGTFTAGGIAGIASWMIIYPFDVIKTRLSTHMSYKEAIRIGGFWNGIELTILRSCIVNSFSFLIFDYLTNLKQI